MTDPDTPQCAIEMIDLAILARLSEGDSIVVQVIATNVKGSSDPSEENTTGATLQGDINPEKPENVTTIVTSTNIQITWDAGAQNLAPITEYDILIKDDNGLFINQLVY